MKSLIAAHVTINDLKTEPFSMNILSFPRDSGVVDEKIYSCSGKFCVEILPKSTDVQLVGLRLHHVSPSFILK